MNLANTRSAMYEYAACAMPLFDRLLQSFSRKYRSTRKRGMGTRTAPLMRERIQVLVWKVLEHATDPLTTQEIYAQIQNVKIDKPTVRSTLLSWERTGWIRKTGMERQYRYERVK